MKRDYLITLAEGISTTNYIALLRVLLSLPPSLSMGREFTNRERNAVRRASLLRKRIMRQHDRRMRSRQKVCKTNQQP